MSNLTYIYQKNVSEIKLLDTLNYTLDEFKVNPQSCYPDWDTETMIASEVKYEYPCLDVSGELREMTKYEKYKKGLYELQFNEVIYKDDVLVLEAGQYVDESGVLQTIPKPEGTRIEWNWKTHEWEEKATNLEIVQAQYKDYEGMDTPSTLEEMKQQDPALATEYLNMMIELRGLIYTLSAGVQPQASETQAVGYAILSIPQPSEKLKEFKNKFKLTK